MTTLVVDASVVVKWVVDEPGTAEALALRARHTLTAPDLIVSECANILWKKVRRAELSTAEARFAALLLESSDLHLQATLPLLTTATELALSLDHPAYDCIYIALALREGCQLVTADETLVRKLLQQQDSALRNVAVLLRDLEP
ncbi:PIN domain-containing protein [Pseudorhizobium endolithicum]|uniref:Ribonuclease VapC n=1 Tax=Pseudorhizobium endolithicum TaxID=1191678 RepID=A0ABN7JEE9_9HYPH|nr:type II toxin-antitoxin system VapC family toxin [Pseudorhizobium endolithicum]CAD7026872.1 PIN domain-containing protein [Pseudorhizobium endolithicum]